MIDLTAEYINMCRMATPLQNFWKMEPQQIDNKVTVEVICNIHPLDMVFDIAKEEPFFIKDRETNLKLDDSQEAHKVEITSVVFEARYLNTLKEEKIPHKDLLNTRFVWLCDIKRCLELIYKTKGGDSALAVFNFGGWIGHYLRESKALRRPTLNSLEKYCIAFTMETLWDLQWSGNSWARRSLIKTPSPGTLLNMKSPPQNKPS